MVRRIRIQPQGRNHEIFVVGAILVVAVILFGNEWLRADTVALLVMLELGEYRFVDFIKVGFPPLLLVMAVARFLPPLVFPLTPPQASRDFRQRTALERECPPGRCLVQLASAVAPEA